MRAAPCRGTEHNLDLLTTRETPHGVVRDELGVETEVREVLLDLATDERAKETKALRLTSIDLENLLLEATLDELVTRHPDVLGRRHVLERDLVLVRLFQLLAGKDLVDETLLALDNDCAALLHLLLLVLGDLAGLLHHLLEILTSLVTPQHVLQGSLVEVAIDVVESVLGNVTDDQVRVLPDLTTAVGLGVTDEELDECRLSGTVGTEDSDTGRERHLEGDVVELLLRLCWVLEADLAHLDEGLLLGLDTLEQWWLGELELVVLSRLESVVRASLRNRLHEGLEVTPVAPELEAVQVENVGDGVVQEAGVVRDDDCVDELEPLHERKSWQ